LSVLLLQLPSFSINQLINQGMLGRRMYLTSVNFPSHLE